MAIDNYYLAHPFDIRRQVREWELEVESLLDLNFINPFYDVKRDDVKDNDKGILKRYEKVNYMELVERDLDQIKHNETKGTFALPVNLNEIFSIGTLHEMVYTTTVFNKPLYTFLIDDNHEHPWIKYHSTEIFTQWAGLHNFLLDSFPIKNGFNRENIFEKLNKKQFHI